MVKGREKPCGFSLTELLAALAIIGLLTTIAVPMLVSRVELARIRTAEAEARELAKAEQECYAIHGFFVPLQVLDDMPTVSGVTQNINDDVIDQETQIFVIDPNQPLGPTLNQTAVNPNFNAITTNPRVRRMRDHWNGPFLQAKRVNVGRAGTDDPSNPNLNSDVIRLDFPLDPWGQPYRFYSPIGLIGTEAELTNPDNWTVRFSDGFVTQDDDRFDRYAIVSYGPDGQSDTDSNGSDDIIYFFGWVISETTYRPF